jgi:site-specific DNA recombinase
LEGAEEQRRARIGELTVEREVAQSDLAGFRAELRQLVPMVGRGDQNTTDRLADLQERIGRTEHRMAEIIQDLKGLDAGRVDEDDFRAALVQFGPVWEALNSREQGRIIRALVDRVAYDGRTNKVTVSFRSAGIRNICRGEEEKQ